MISNIRDNLSNVNFLQYNGERQANGHPAKLPEGSISEDRSLRNFASFQAKNRSATEVHISKAGLEAFKKMQTSIVDMEKKSSLIDIEMQMKRLSMPEHSSELMEINSKIKFQESFLERRPQMEEQLEKLRNTEPVAAKVLNKEEVKAAFALAALLGKRVGGAGDFTYSFSHENTTYTFTREGEVLTNEMNIPTSAADKARKIKGLQRIMSYGDPSPELAARRDTLTAEMNVRNEAKQVKMAELIAERDALLAA